MAANTVQLMDAMASPTAFGPNPHKWAPGVEVTPGDPNVPFPGAYDSEYNQYAYDIDGIMHSIVTELEQLGVKRYGSVLTYPFNQHLDPLPLDEPGEFLNWNTLGAADTQSKKNLFRYMTTGGYTGGLRGPVDPTLDFYALSLDNLYNLANNMVWCYHNLYSFAAWTDFISGAVPKSDTVLYIRHPELAANFSHFSQVISLATSYDSANSTHNAQSIMSTSINATSVSLISNSSPFAANDYSFADGLALMELNNSNAPSINSIAMWFYTANGTVSSDRRPPGLEIDKIDGVHPAQNMTPAGVYTHFLSRIQNYNKMIQDFLVDSPGIQLSYHLQGVTPANTFIYEAQDWLQKRTEALHIIDIMSRTTLPGGSSIAVQNAIANTS